MRERLLSAAWLVPLLLGGCRNGDARLEAHLPEVGSPSLLIGGVEAKEEAAFVLIRKVEVDRQGGILILDPFTTHIAWFGPDGRFIANLGRSGSGPGEFKRPQGMAIDEQNRLHVLDAGRRAIVIFALHDTIAAHLGDQRVEGSAGDICVAGGRRFLATLREQSGIDEIDDHGRVIRSFGAVEGPAPVAGAEERAARSFRGFYNQVLMTCDAWSGTIFLLHENVPVVRAFSFDGDLKWRTVLENFHGRQVQLTGTGVSARTVAEDGSAHAGVAIAIVGDDQLVVTLWETSPANRQGRLDARVLNANTGAELSRMTPPARLALEGNGRFYAFDQYPAPKVMRFESWPIPRD